MKVILIRHGEPDYDKCTEIGFTGLGRDMAPLTLKGVDQATKVAQFPGLKECQKIIVSPYTRALQTAAIIAGETGLKIEVEMNLHEWINDTTFSCSSSEEALSLYADFCECKGVIPKGEKRVWESLEEVQRRVQNVLEKYKSDSKIAIVAHGVVIERILGKTPIKYCYPYEMEIDSDFRCYGWIEQ